MNRLIAIDLDEVIANCVKYALSIINKQLNLDIQEEELWKVDLKEILPQPAYFLFTQLINNFDFVLSQPCYQEGKNFLKWLRENGWTIVIVTARPEYLKSASMEWLRKNNLCYDFIYMTDKKENFAKICDYLIDDNPKIIKNWCLKGGKAFMIDKPFNRRSRLERYYSVKRVKSFDEIIQYLTKEEKNE